LYGEIRWLRNGERKVSIAGHDLEQSHRAQDCRLVYGWLRAVVNKLPRVGRLPNQDDLELATRRIIAALLREGRRRITFEILARFLAEDTEFFKAKKWDPDLASINATRLKDKLKYRGLTLRRLLQEEKTRLNG
jgi:hypothetical protein